MKQMFTLVKKLGIKSLALPALGTGGLSYPPEIVAIEMMRSIYLHAAQSGVNTVTIVVYKVSPEHKVSVLLTMLNIQKLYDSSAADTIENIVTLWAIATITTKLPTIFGNITFP